MKTNLETNMEQILNLPAQIPLVEKINENKVSVMAPINAGEDDFEYARKNLKSIIETASTAIDDLSDIATSSESPRAYEVLSTLMKTTIEANKDLLNLQKQMKDIKGNEQSEKSVTNNAVFVGSTSELLKMLKGDT
jgi:hypothetical protein